MPNIKVENFAAGMNTLFDPRDLQNDESPEIINMEITAKGSVVCSTGYELVSALGGGATGGTKNIITYEKTPDTGDHYLIITHDDDHYEVDPADFTWNSIGDYGTAANNVGGMVYKGSSGTRRVILGTDESANDISDWDDTTFAALFDPPGSGWIMDNFMGRLFIANAATLHYSDTEDEDDFAGGGTVSFNDYITGVKAQDEFMIVFTRDDANLVTFFYNDAFSLSGALQKPYRNSSGCLAHKTIQPVYNDVYHLSKDGVQRFGADAQFLGSNLRVNSLSWKINPSITKDAINHDEIERACGIYFDRRYWLALPSPASSINDAIFVYNYDFDSWTKRTGIFPSAFAVLEDTTKAPELYFGHHSTPELYKFVNSFDYEGAGYDRSWKSKIFTGTNAMTTKYWRWLELRGSKFIGTKIKVDMTVDSVTKTYEIDDDALVPAQGGGFYGDDFYGDVFYGGTFSGRFKRWAARLPFPAEITRGQEFQFKIYNSAAGQAWSLNYANIFFEEEALVKIPTYAQTATVIS